VVIDKKCFTRKCYRAHDITHNGEYHCITNYLYGCPDDIL